MSKSVPAAVAQDGARQLPTAAALGALGIVYGDIGTSPLYALKEAAKAAADGSTPTPDAILGVMSQARGATEDELLCSGQGASQDRQRYLAGRGAPLPFLSSRELQRARRGAASQSVRKRVPLRRRSGAAEGWDAGIGKA